MAPLLWWYDFISSLLFSHILILLLVIIFCTLPTLFLSSQPQPMDLDRRRAGVSQVLKWIKVLCTDLRGHFEQIPQTSIPLVVLECGIVVTQMRIFRRWRVEWSPSWVRPDWFRTSNRPIGRTFSAFHSRNKTRTNLYLWHDGPLRACPLRNP